MLDGETRALGQARALEARRLRAAMKVGLRSGSLSAAEVLQRRSDDPVVARMRVTDFIEAVPGIGPVRAAAILDRCAIAPSRRLRGLGEQQAASLLIELSAHQRQPGAR